MIELQGGIMKGLTYQELTKLLQYIEDNHSWKNMYDLHVNYHDPKGA